MKSKQKLYFALFFSLFFSSIPFPQLTRAQCSPDHLSLQASLYIYSCETGEDFWKAEIEISNENAEASCHNHEIWMDQLEIFLHDPQNSARQILPIARLVDKDTGSPLSFPFNMTSMKKTVTVWGYMSSTNLRHNPALRMQFEAMTGGRIVDFNRRGRTENFQLQQSPSQPIHLQSASCNIPLAQAYATYKEDPGRNQISTRWFPTPSQNHALLEIQLAKASKIEIEILNLQGQRVLTPLKFESIARVKRRLKIDISPLPAGIYYSKIKTETEEEMVKWVKIE